MSKFAIQAWFRKLHSSSPLHCSGRVADVGCRTCISAGVASTPAWTAAMRGSES
jgi:hypothetical protein